MDEIAKPQAAPTKRRWWKRAAATFALIVIGSVVLLPNLLSTEKARLWLLDRANRALSPGRIQTEGFRFSWMRPTRIDGFVLYDPQGNKVVESDRVFWNRNLFQILFQRPKYGTFQFEGAVVDIERAKDGTIDIIESLRAILKGTPPTDWTIQLTDASLRLRSPELARPIEAKSFDLTIRRPAAPGDISWDGVLTNESGHELAINGTYARWDKMPEGQHGLAVGFLADKWPLALAVNGISASADLVGRVGANRGDRKWSLEGEAQLVGLDLAGTALSGDRVRFDTMGGRWSFGQTDSGWAISALDLRSPIGTLHASGPIPAAADHPARIVGSQDLAKLATQLPRTLRLRQGQMVDRGKVEVVVDVEAKADRRLWTASAQISDLAGHLGETTTTLREPAKISAKVVEFGDKLTLENVSLNSAFLKAEGRGDLDHGINLNGELDLASLSRQVADFVDLGRYNLSGSGTFTAGLKREAGNLVGQVETAFGEVNIGPREDPLRLEGLQIRGSAKGNSEANFSTWQFNSEIAVNSASKAGLALGKTRLVGHHDRSVIAFEPIETTLNGGRLRLVPELITEPVLLLKLGPGSELVDAEVNEEATRRVLSFVAPILEGTTRARGRVSAKIDRAEFPIGANARKKAVVEGNVVFQDVVFTPGPFASGVLEMIGRSDSTMRLDQPVVLSISDGMIHQRGLAVPVGDLTKIEIEGSVGFDRSLDLRTTLPLTSAMFPNNSALADVIAGARITVPIRGTLDKPQIDKDAFRAGLADMGKGLLLRGATRGASELLFRLARPRDPNAPPSLTPEERKAKRLERRTQKRSAG